MSVILPNTVVVILGARPIVGLLREGQYRAGTIWSSLSIHPLSPPKTASCCPQASISPTEPQAERHCGQAFLKQFPPLMLCRISTIHRHSSNTTYQLAQRKLSLLLGVPFPFGIACRVHQPAELPQIQLARQLGLDLSK